MGGSFAGNAYATCTFGGTNNFVTGDGTYGMYIKGGSSTIWHPCNDQYATFPDDPCAQANVPIYIITATYATT
jgi:hypothetical protein